MKVTAPSEADITSVLMELDENFDGSVDKEEFLQLIVLVLGKMLESEEDLVDQEMRSKESKDIAKTNMLGIL